MKGYSRSSFLEEFMELLVRNFGSERVQAALTKVSGKSDLRAQSAPAGITSKRPSKSARPTVASLLEAIITSDPERHRLLSEFHTHLRAASILPEAQDIRHFAQIAGLKEIDGKARKEMIPALMLFLIEKSTEWLRKTLPMADSISEQQRQRSFSILTDKLLGRGG